MEKTVKIYYTSDTHGYLFPSTYSDNSEKPAGLLNCIANFQKDGNTLILDGGDTLQGSPMALYLASGKDKEPLADTAIAKVFNTGGYHGITLGNHDFNFGYQYLERYLKALSSICICANVADKKGRLGVKGSHIYTMENGLRIGVTGVVTDFVNVWEQPEHLQDIVISDAFEVAKHQLEQLKRECDVTVCIYHGGYECDLETGRVLSGTGENVGGRICRELDFDLLLTAHQHMEIPGQTIDGTYTLQLAPNAVQYASVEIGCGESGIWITSEICPAGWGFAKEPYQSLLPLEEAVQKWLDERVGRLEHAILPKPKLEMALYGSQVGDLFNQIQLAYSGADISCVGLGNTPVGFSKEIITRDVVSVYPFANTMVILEVDKEVLTTALERCAEYFSMEHGEIKISDAFLIPKIEHYNYDFFAGISYEFDLNRPVGQRVVKLLYHGAPIGNKTLTLCMSDYRASGTGGYDIYRDCRVVKRIGKEIQQLALQYFKEHETVKLSVKTDIHVIIPQNV